jgi:mycothiol system anti-sigma-R factor
MSEGESWAELDCEEAIHRLYDFLDGELTVERKVAMRAHLDECSPCVRAFGFEAELRELISACCHEQIPPGLKERIATALEQERRVTAKGERGV